MPDRRAGSPDEGGQRWAGSEDQEAVADTKARHAARRVKLEQASELSKEAFLI